METSPRVRLEWVPRRRAFRSARAASWTSASWNGSLKISLGRSLFACFPSVVAFGPAAVFVAAVCEDFRVAFALVCASAIAAHLHRGVLAAGDGAPDQEQVALSVDLDDVGAALGHPARSHLSRHPHALEDAGGVGARADRAGCADVVRAVGLGATAEVVSLDRALEALADGDRGDLDLLAGLEAGDGDVVADLDLGSGVARLLARAFALALGGLPAGGTGGDVGVAELDERPHPRRTGLLQVAGLGHPDPVLANRDGGELDSVVAVAVRLADRGHLVRRGLDHGHGNGGAVLEEDAGHTELLSDDRSHLKGGSPRRRRRGGSPSAAARQRSSGWAGGCRSAACGCGSRSARVSPCP